MTDHRADRPVVDGVVGRHCEERRLQDRGREDDLVHLGVVVSVHRLRVHVPLVPVHRTPEFVHLVVVVPPAGRPNRGDEVAGDEPHVRVVLPDVRVPDLRGEHLELGVRLLLGLVRHPVQTVDRLLEGREQVVDEFEHARLVLRREVLSHVLLAEGLSDHALHEVDAALPAGAHLRHPAQHLAVEVEGGLHGLLGQQSRERAEDPPAQVRPPVLQRDLLQQLRVGLGVVGLGDVECLDAIDDTDTSQVGVPVVAGGEIGQFTEAVLVVGLHRVPVGDLRPVQLREAGLKIHDACGIVGSPHAAPLQHRTDMLEIGRTHLGEVLLEVVVAVRQAEPALPHVEYISGGVAVVLVHRPTDGRPHTLPLETPEQFRQLRDRRHGIDLLEQIHDR